MTTIKIVELVGCSPNSWEEAVRSAVKETLRKASHKLPLPVKKNVERN